MGKEGEKNEVNVREEKILAFWEERDIFAKSLDKHAPLGEYVFYEGPPTANGKPGIHHLEARSFKDALPRYKTMRGYHVARRAGWDTHGLPVELEVEKELGFSGKKQIEEYGIAKFNKKCRESVLAYISEWDRFTKRIGYWVDQKKAYFTFDAPYMESLFSIVKKVSDDGRLYKDYRIVPWCARCGTALSSHELAQGYADVKDLSVTAKFKVKGEDDTYLLAWTTTPWTLLGNVALAVGKDISYGIYEKDSEKVITATKRAESMLADWVLTKEVSGSELVGKEYEPLFPYFKDVVTGAEKEKIDTAYRVYEADFVTTEDGTGIVHTAVMYGADDFALGNSVGLPKVHTVGADGKFIEGTGPYTGRFVKDDDVAVDIIKDLAHTGKLFSKEKYEHSYPFCWRCKTPLIYYARDSWYIRMQDLKDTLVKENGKVNWEPSHIRDGRMGEWLSNVKDWAISRERYWGTPLPIWENETNSEDRIVVGSLDELKSLSKKSGNEYFLMRHGESQSNATRTLNGLEDPTNGLTEQGRSQVLRSASLLGDKNITKIIASPLTRTKETAQLLQQELGLSEDAVVFDERLREVTFGVWEGKSVDEYVRSFVSVEELMATPVEGGESWDDVRKRVGACLYDIDATYNNERVLIVAHGAPLRMLIAVSRGMTVREFSHEWQIARDPANAEVRDMPFTPLPHNDCYELDLHRPFIDDVVLQKEGKTYRRVKEVMDVWFDSGSMPFAQDHYPFKNKEWVEGDGYPADFISEAIDQTRGWFYTLLAVGVLMDRGHAYKNAICLGHLLDKEGQKMSKSKGNVINPWTAIEEYGVDALRFWMYSVNQSGDSKSFDEKTVKESVRTLSWLSNSAKFYELFKEGEGHPKDAEVIDRWMISRTNQTVKEMTDALDAYKLYDATRSLALLFEDLSQWYVRRVRDRVRDGDTGARATLRETLLTSSKLLAPFSPFLAEEIYQLTKGKEDAESVHLSTWPVGGAIDEALIQDMASLREVASEALMLRQKSGHKVRQVLGSVTTSLSLTDEMVELLKSEVNVKEVKRGDTTELDTVLTPELEKEGDEREKMRAVAEARKQLGFHPRDTATVSWGAGPFGVELSTGTERFNVERHAS